MTVAKGKFELTGWRENAYVEVDDRRKLTRASVTQDFTGDLTGKGSVEWLMSYQPDGTARFVGLQRVEGIVSGAEGSFVLETVGDFDGTEAKGTWTVIAGSGTGQLAGLAGTGSFRAPHGPTATYEFEYTLA
ncbi:MAG TPA: DUF3224 domain-containing protein [Acidimicrobiales bacterium]|nr:DUF3224 domain-containing protein [Acidimicrobiales bacterium]